MFRFLLLLSFFLSFFPISELHAKQENNDRSTVIVRLILKDTTDISYQVFDNDNPIGNITKMEQISWQRTSGLMILKIVDNPKIPQIEIDLPDNTICEIELYPTRYSVKYYDLGNNKTEKIAHNPDYKIIFGIFLLAFFFFTIFLANRRRKNRFKKAISLLDKEIYDPAIKILLSIKKTKAKDPEYWILLEKAYLKIGDLESANECKKNLISLKHNTLIPSKKDNTTRIYDWQKLISKFREQGLEFEKINPVKLLKKGYYGSRIYLLELIGNSDSAIYAVIKILSQRQKQNAPNELLREYEGYLLFKKMWKEKVTNHLPELIFRIEDVQNPLLLTTFADKKNTKSVLTLSEALKNNLNANMKIIREIGLMYYHESMTIEAENRFFRSPWEHIKRNINDKFSHILGFNWSDYQILPEKKYIQINGRLYPNMIFFFQNHKGNWTDEKLSLPEYIVHGDLNPQNVIITSHPNFIFIDFEKCGYRNIFYDLSFLTVWLLEIFVTPSITKYNFLEILDEISLLLMNNQISGKPELTNFSQIFSELWSFKSKLSQNDLIGINCSFISTFMLRSYYQFRDAERNRKKAKKNINKALLFYAIGCILLDKAEIAIKEDVSATLAFDLPKFRE